MTTLPDTPTLHTERLTLRPLVLGDAPAVQALFPHWEIVRFMGHSITWPYADDGALTNIKDCLGRRARGEKFFWAITLRGREADLIGRIDLWPDDGATRDMRGFWLGLEFQGQGLMTEAAERVTRYAFEALGWPHLYLTNAKANLASRRVKEKQGAELIDTEPMTYISGEGEREIWRLRREDWLARRASGPKESRTP